MANTMPIVHPHITEVMREAYELSIRHEAEVDVLRYVSYLHQTKTWVERDTAPLIFSLERIRADHGPAWAIYASGVVEATTRWLSLDHRGTIRRWRCDLIDSLAGSVPLEPTHPGLVELKAVYADLTRDERRYLGQSFPKLTEALARIESQ